MKNSRTTTSESSEDTKPREKACHHERRRNPWLEAGVRDFYDPADGRQWLVRCELKRQIMRGYAKLGPKASNECLSGFLVWEDRSHVSLRTVERGVAILKKQRFVSDIKRLHWNWPMLRQLHPERLGAFQAPGSESQKVPTSSEKASTKVPVQQTKMAVPFSEDGGPTFAKMAVPLGEDGGMNSPHAIPPEVIPQEGVGVKSVPNGAHRSIAVSSPEDAGLRSASNELLEPSGGGCAPSTPLGKEKATPPDRKERAVSNSRRVSPSKRKVAGSPRCTDAIRKEGYAIGDRKLEPEELEVLEFIRYDKRDYGNLSEGILEGLVVKREKYPNKSPWLLCCKAMDYCDDQIERARTDKYTDATEYYWPAEFQAHRDRLRAEERESEQRGGRATAQAHREDAVEGHTVKLAEARTVKQEKPDQPAGSGSTHGSAEAPSRRELLLRECDVELAKRGIGPELYGDISVGWFRDIFVMDPWTSFERRMAALREQARLHRFKINPKLEARKAVSA